MSALRVSWHMGDGGIADCASAWEAVDAVTGYAMPMHATPWVSAFTATLRPAGSEPYFALVYECDRPIAALALNVRRRGFRWLGFDTASTPYHPHAAHGNLMVIPGHAVAATGAILASARTELGVELAELALRGVDARNSSAQELARGFPGATVLHIHRNMGSYLPVPKSPEALMRGLSKNFRATLRKSLNRFESRGRYGFKWLDGEKAARGVRDVFLKLEASGWKGREGTAIACDRTLVAFYERMVDNFAEIGRLECQMLTLDDRPVAFNLGIRCGRRLVLQKIAYDDSDATLGPGHLLFRQTVVDAMDRGDIDEIDCLTDAGWHRSWRMPQREYMDLRIYPRTASAMVFGLLPRRLRELVRIRAGAAGSPAPSTSGD